MAMSIAPAVLHGQHVVYAGADEPLDGADVLLSFSLWLRHLLAEIAEEEAE